MSLAIPNSGDTAIAAQAMPDSGDFGAIVAGIARTGVLSGCAVTAQGTPDMTLAVGLGVTLVAGVRSTVTAGNVTVTAAHALLPRFDLVVSTAGTKSVIAGTPSAIAVFPDFNEATQVLLAAVYVPAAVTTIVGAYIVDKRVLLPGATTIRAADFGVVLDGVTDNAAALTAAIAALPAYSASFGGGTVVLDAGVCLVATAVTIPSGVRLLGMGMRSSVIKGTIAGPLLTSTAGTLYPALENLAVWNLSTSSSARAIDLIGVSCFTATRCSFLSSGGYIVAMRTGTIVSGLISCRIGGGAGADAAVYMDGGANGNRLINCSITDAKSGIVVISGTALTVIGCHFESMAGGSATLQGAIAFSALTGTTIRGNYFEACAGNAIVGYSNTGWNYAIDIGGNFISNCGVITIDISSMRYSQIGVNYIVPGAISPNANGVYGNGAGCIGNTVHAQYLASGSGAAVYLAGGAENLALAGGYFEGDEIADPAAPNANRGRLYFRDNGSGKTQLAVRFPTGAVQVLATEP